MNKMQFRISKYHILVSSVAMGLMFGCGSIERVNRKGPDELEWAGFESSDDSFGPSGIVGGKSGRVQGVVGILTPDGALCTGSLVASNVVLTAAHCVVSNRGDNDVVGGSVFVGSSSRSAVESATIVDAAVSPQMHFSGMGAGNHDIAVVRLETELTETAVVRFNPKSLPRGLKAKVLVAGYGATSEENADAGSERYVKVPIQSISSTAIVAFGEGTGPCYGDSGGPAFAKNSQGVTLVIGVVSGNGGHGRCGNTGYFSRTDVDSEFIQAAIDAWSDETSSADE